MLQADHGDDEKGDDDGHERRSCQDQGSAAESGEEVYTMGRLEKESDLRFSVSD